MAVFKFRNLNSGQAMPVPPGEYTVGRVDESYVRVDDPSVSRTHARIFNGEDGFFIEDAGSSNGTALRGAYITERMKMDFGEIVYIGSVPFRVDPEVTGEAGKSQTLPTIARSTNQISMRRPTERIPSIGEPARVVEAIPQEQLSAPAVQAGESDADDLNAVVMREPEPPVQPVAGVAAPVNPSRDRGAVPVPVPMPTPRPTPTPAPTPAPKVQPQARPQPAAKVAPPQVQAREVSSAVQPVVEKDWKGLLPAFLAGLGTGLVLGFILAKFLLP